MNAVECLLKSENFSVAARLDPWSADAPAWLELAVAWRVRALEDKRGAIQTSRALHKRKDDIALWRAIVEPEISRH